MDDTRPAFVVRTADVTEIEDHYPHPFDAERLTFGRELGRAAGSRAIGVWEQRIPPGRRTSFTHAHLREEELIYVLSGAPTLRWIPPGEAPREIALGRGDLVAFPAGTGIAHTVVNRTEEDALLLVIGERHAAERVAYPEDQAYMAHRLRERPLATWDDALGPAASAIPPAWRIETERLVLMPWRLDEVQAAVSLLQANVSHLDPWMPWIRDPLTVDHYLGVLGRFLADFATGTDDLVYAIRAPDGLPIGGCGLHARVGPSTFEVGYWIDHRYQGRGYVTEAVAALAQVAFEAHGVDRLEIRCNPANERSSAVAARLGFRHEATLARRLPQADGALHDAMIWSAYREDPRPTGSARAWDGAGRRLL